MRTEVGVKSRAMPAASHRAWWRSAYEYTALQAGLIGLAASGFLWSLIALPLHWFLPRALGTAIGRTAIMRLLRVYLAALEGVGGCRFDIRDLDQLRSAGPIIIAPNHPCLLDAFMVLSRLPNVACVMKASVMNNPFFGGGARLARYIRNDSSVSAILRALDELRFGTQVLIFPEGTRTTRLPVNRFVASIAVLAARARVPVQTVFIETDSAFLSKYWPLFRRPTLPITYRVRLGKRFEIAGDPAEFTRSLEQYFSDELARPRPDGAPRVVISEPRMK